MVNMKKNSLPYALNSHNELVHVDDVPTGKECGCICPHCKAPLVAKNSGNIKVHHFAHIGEDSCIHAFQSMLHILAKDIFNEARVFTVSKERFGQKQLMQYNITSVSLETKVGDIIPDIILDCDGIEYFVEIYVTHALDNEKKKKIEELGVSTVEYDLSKIDRNITKDQLRNILFNSSPDDIIKWKHDADINRFMAKYSFIRENGIEQVKESGKVCNCPMAMLPSRYDGHLEQFKIKESTCKRCIFFSGYDFKNDDKACFCGCNIKGMTINDVRVLNGAQIVLTNSQLKNLMDSFFGKLRKEAYDIAYPPRPKRGRRNFWV